VGGQLTLSGNVTGVPQGSVAIGPLTVTPSASNLWNELTLSLASGANTITVPTWALFCLIQPASNNTVGLTLKGVTGDTGVPLSLTNPTLLSFAATPPATIVLTAAAPFTTATSVSFF
jgi:hypothetical protein